MIANATTTYVLGKALSAIAFVTTSYIHLNEGAAWPVGFRIPVPAGNTGLTIVYYTRLLSGQFERYCLYVDGSDGVGGGLHAQEVSYRGLFASTGDGLRVNGQPFYYGTRYIYAARDWTQVALKTIGNTSPRGNGSLYFNLAAGSHSPQDGLPGVDYAYVAVYQRELSDAEIAAVLPPADYGQLYAFAGYQPGDVRLPEATGTGLDGEYLY